MRMFKGIFILFGILSMLASSPLLLLGILGLCGVLADVSVAENRAFGMKFLSMGLPVFGGGIVIVAMCLMIKTDRS